MEKKLDFRIEKTYLFLHNAFTELLNEKQFEDFTVNELCQRAMIRRTTFYKHFADKYEYFTFYVKEIAAEFREGLPPDVCNKDLSGYSLHMSRELLRFMEEHKVLVKHIIESNMFPILQDSMFDIIRQEIMPVLRNTDAGKGMSTQQLEAVATFYSGGMLYSILAWFKSREPFDEAVLELMLKGF